VKVLSARVADGTAAGALRELGEKLRDKLGDRSAVCLGAGGADKAQICIMVSKLVAERAKAGDLVREVAKRVGGSGGGRPDMAQAGGPDVGGLDEALESFYGEVKAALTR
jgi:alanyl-tRNA synthetase